MGLILISLLASAYPSAAAQKAEEPDLSPVVALEETSPFSEESLKIRDPFRSPVVTGGAEVPELERFSLEQIRLVGIMSGHARKRAMLSLPNGKTVFVQENTRLGNRNGVIKRISDDKILVSERLINVLGQEEIVETAINLPGEKRAPNQGAAPVPLTLPRRNSQATMPHPHFGSTTSEPTVGAVMTVN